MKNAHLSFMLMLSISIFFMVTALASTSVTRQWPFLINPFLGVGLPYNFEYFYLPLMIQYAIVLGMILTTLFTQRRMLHSNEFSKKDNVLLLVCINLIFLSCIVFFLFYIRFYGISMDLGDICGYSVFVPYMIFPLSFFLLGINVSQEISGLIAIRFFMLMNAGNPTFSTTSVNCIDKDNTTVVKFIQKLWRILIFMIFFLVLYIIIHPLLFILGYNLVYKSLHYIGDYLDWSRLTFMIIVIIGIITIALIILYGFITVKKSKEK